MKHIFLDIDGTFLNPKNNEVPQSTLTAIEAATKKGHRVYLCTGRPTSSLKRFMDYPMSGIICAGGSHICINNKVIFEKTLTPTQIKFVEKICANNHCGYLLEGKNFNYASKLGAEQFMETIKDSSFGSTWEEVAEELGILNLEDLMDDQIFKISFYTKDKNIIEQVRKDLGSEFSIAYTSKEPGKIIETEIFSAGCNKADGIKRVVEYYGQTLDDAIGIGDSMNDYEMIQECNPGVAMGNACQEIKDIADFITKDVDQDGIYFAFEYFDLI